MRRVAQRQDASVVLFLLIVLALIGAGIYMMFDFRKSREAEAREFGKEVVQRLAVEHDLKYLHLIVPVEHRPEFTPGREESFIETFKSLGVPQPGWHLEGDVSFENYFFARKAIFKAMLTYPERHATISLNISCPRGPWQLNSLGITWERTPEESAALKR